MSSSLQSGYLWLSKTTVAMIVMPTSRLHNCSPHTNSRGGGKHYTCLTWHVSIVIHHELVKETFGSKHRSAEVQPHRAAHTAEDTCEDFMFPN